MAELPLQNFCGCPITGIIFDGSFETAVAIVENVKLVLGFAKADKFRLDLAGGQTALSFQVPGRNRAGQAVTVELRMAAGDFLAVAGRSYRVIPGAIFHEYFQPATDAGERGHHER